jgi:arylsulfatase A-like enzyme
MIRRREFLKALGGSVLFAPLASCASLEPKTPYPISDRKPNIIIIMADDLGYGDLSCYGGKHAKTPHIDALATGGMKFTDYHSNGAVCSPTRAALITGRYQQRSGISGVVTARGHRHTGLDLKETTFAEVLKSSGYTTALFGKWHLGYQVDFNPAKQGFDYFTGYVSGNIDYKSHYDQEGHEDWWEGTDLKPQEGYSTYLIARHGLRFLEKHKAQSFCLYLAHEAPHYPYQGPDDPAYRKAGNGKPVAGIRKDKLNAYWEMIEAMDKTVGQIVDKVKQLGLEKNTFIFYCSDNGSAHHESNGGLKGKKGTVWEGGHRVPGIAYWPGRERSRPGR